MGMKPVELMTSGYDDGGFYSYHETLDEAMQKAAQVYSETLGVPMTINDGGQVYALEDMEAYWDENGIAYSGQF